MRYILGLGNYAMGDDGIGLRIIESIAEQGLDEDFEAIEIANNGMQVLTYFEEQTELLVIVDAVSFGGQPGDITVFSPEDVNSHKVTSGISTHEGDILKLIELGRQIEQHIPPIRIVAIEPASMKIDCNLSPELTARFDEYVKTVIKEIQSAL
jgi:hydrogenase maturation protease